MQVERDNWILCSAPTEMHDIPAHRGSIQKVRIPFVFASSSQALYCLLSAIVASHPVDKILKVTPLRECWLSVKSGVPFVSQNSFLFFPLSKMELTVLCVQS